MSGPTPPAGQLALLASEPHSEPEEPSIRIVVPCSKRKSAAGCPASLLELDESRVAVEARLAAYSRMARDMYSGRAYSKARAAVDRFRMLRPDLPIALHIASAGYGLVNADDRLVPYEATMGANRSQWIARGLRLGMPAKARSLVESSLVTVFALSEPYRIAAGIPELEPAAGTAVVIGLSKSHVSGRAFSIWAGRREARGLHTTDREVGAVVLTRLLDRIATAGLSTVSSLSPDPLEWPTS